ncbi:hypothetical protein NC653_038812 [Populus alba x Populus x berolinensis]|uniref:Cytochrome b561 domain-containing protein n=1 Tax=Populus alba x Populus x berolinensis TaxID=444605 RepID=A0AAD6PTV7_9ROSI|nr:hypothetical protein NC653_038812 [Populus alba x Populus x berolinensis]
MAVPVVKFPILMRLIRLLGVLVTALVLTWTVHYRGGLALVSANKDLIFNAHPVLMVIGLVLVNGEGNYPFSALLALLVCEFICIGEEMTNQENEQKRVNDYKMNDFVLSWRSLIGFWAALKFHNDKGIDNLYSLHSWLGLACLFLFSIQEVQETAGPPCFHGMCFSGVYIYALSVATATTGILEKVTFLQTNNVISRYSTEALLVNSLGILMIVLGGFVVSCISYFSEEQRRHP